MAYLGLPLPEGGIKIWSQASFHMPTNPAEVPKAIGPTFGAIKAKTLQDNPLDFFPTIPFRCPLFIILTFYLKIKHVGSQGFGVQVKYKI